MPSAVAPTTPPTRTSCTRSVWRLAKPRRSRPRLVLADNGSCWPSLAYAIGGRFGGHLDFLCRRCTHHLRRTAHVVYRQATDVDLTRSAEILLHSLSASVVRGQASRDDGTEELRWAAGAVVERRIRPLRSSAESACCTERAEAEVRLLKGVVLPLELLEERGGLTLRRRGRRRRA
jgi:hypothetical protein